MRLRLSRHLGHVEHNTDQAGSLAEQQTTACDVQARLAKLQAEAKQCSTSLLDLKARHEAARRSEAALKSQLAQSAAVDRKSALQARVVGGCSPHPGAQAQVV